MRKRVSLQATERRVAMLTERAEREAAQVAAYRHTL